MRERVRERDVWLVGGGGGGVADKNMLRLVGDKYRFFNLIVLLLDALRKHTDIALLILSFYCLLH